MIQGRSAAIASSRFVPDIPFDVNDLDVAIYRRQLRVSDST